MFDTKITKGQVNAIAVFFKAARELSDTRELMDSTGRGARGVPERLNEATKQYDVAVRAAAEAFGEENK